jgi:hypothetical protein
MSSALLAARTQLRLLPFCDRWAQPFELGGAFRVQFNEPYPRIRNCGVRKDRFHGAFRSTAVAVDAVLRGNVELHVVSVEAFAWADDNAIGVLAVVARLANNKGHELYLQD